LAVSGILPERPGLVLSGINKGANLGDDITYSGTVSAAMEGTLLGIPSIAVSLVARDVFDFSAAAEFAALLATQVLSHSLPDSTLLNVNVPSIPRGQMKGFQLTRQGKRRYSQALVEKVDPRGKKYYWIGGDEFGFVDEPGTDFAAVNAGAVSITPIHLDLTHYPSFQVLEQLTVEWP
jgi:5'-nucleotidase